jgi:hypothetical protein
MGRASRLKHERREAENSSAAGAKGATAARVALVVGNGLSIDLMKHAGDDVERRWHPSAPLSWKPEIFQGPLLPRFPGLAKEVSALRADRPELDDISLLVGVVRRVRELMEQQHSDRTAADRFADLLQQAQFFLAYAYTEQYLSVARYVTKDWRWYEWVVRHRQYIAGAVSFNYDLTLEHLLDLAGVRLTRHGIQHRRGGDDLDGIPVIKPHGSIDFGNAWVPSHAGVKFMNSDLPQTTLTAKQMLGKRTEVNLVLPGQLSDMRGLRWVDASYREFERLGHSFTHGVFIGVSCWDVDRPELEDITDAFAPDARLIIANPRPEELEAMMRARGRNPELWTSGPQRL